MSMRKVQPYLAALMAVAVSAPPSLAQQNTQVQKNDSGWYSRLTDRYTHREVAPINLSNSGRIGCVAARRTSVSVSAGRRSSGARE